MNCFSSAEAILIYSESFDYGGADSSLSGLNGGTGFSAAWTQQNSGITYSASGLNFNGIYVSGGMASAIGVGSIGNALFYRQLNSSLSGIYYGAFLTEVLATTNNNADKIAMILGAAASFPGDEAAAIQSPYNSSGLNTSVGFLASPPALH